MLREEKIRLLFIDYDHTADLICPLMNHSLIFILTESAQSQPSYTFLSKRENDRCLPQGSHGSQCWNDARRKVFKTVNIITQYLQPDKWQLHLQQVMYKMIVHSWNWKHHFKLENCVFFMETNFMTPALWWQGWAWAVQEEVVARVQGPTPSALTGCDHGEAEWWTSCAPERCLELE